MVAYRTNGAWGPGTGYDLRAPTIDENFYRLQQRVGKLASDPPTPVGVSDVQFNADEVTLHLTNGQTLGPFAMPQIAYNWTGDWEPSTTYNVFDLFYVEGTGLFLVIDPYTSPSEFDPEDSSIQHAFGLLGEEVHPRPVFNTATVSEYLTLARAGFYIRYRSEGAVVRINSDADGGWHEGVNFVLRQVEAGTLTVTPDDDVDLITPTGQESFSAAAGSVIYLRWVGPDTWEAYGDLSAPLASEE